MDEERPVIDTTHNMEKQRKHKVKKAKKNEENTMGREKPLNVGKNESIEDAQISENEDIAEAKRHPKRDKEKKRNKGNRDIESSMEHGPNGIKKRKNKNTEKKEKSKEKDDMPQGDNVKEVENEKWIEGEAVSKMKCKEHKKKNRNNQDGKIGKEWSKDGGDVSSHIEKCKVNNAGMVRTKKRKRDDNGESTLDLVASNDSAANRTVGNENHRDNQSETVGDFGKETERKKKKRRKKESGEGVLISQQQNNLPENFEDNTQSTKNCKKELERKKGHKKKSVYEDDSSGARQESVDDDSNVLTHSAEIQSNKVESANRGKVKKLNVVENGSNEVRDTDAEHAKKGKKKKKTKLVGKSSEDDGLSAGKGNKLNCVLEENNSNVVKSAMKGKAKRKKLVEDGSSDQTPNKSNKKVKFSDQNEVFPVPVDPNTEKENADEDNLVRGKRFTFEEDVVVKEAVEKYMEDHDLGEDGLHMILNSSKYPEVKGCWKEIGSAIPYRPYTSIYYRAQILFRRSENRKWTQEEYDEILKYQEEHGNQWKQLADELGKHRFHVKDTWRRIKLANKNKGQWSQNEYQKLFDLVNTDLQLKVSEEKKSKHGMLRDNIPWTAISDTLSTRSQATCCIKWYKQLSSPMVSEGLWADADDYRLLDALYSLDATCMEDVDWDDLLDNRSGDLCRKRWNQMVLHIGQHGNKSFDEQVEVLAQRYCPRLVEARETWDSKPRVP